VREALFVKKNKARWEKMQHQLPVDADETAKEFARLVDDLGYAKTFYPGSKVTQFINSLAAKIYLGIYRNRKEESNRLVKFWKQDLPLTIRKHHGIIFVLFLLFCIFFAIGFFSAKNDPQFVREMLGDNYVDMTEENIEKGNPFGVYQSGSSLVVWLGIFFHNMIICLTYFAKGLLFGIFTIISLLKFAVMIGSFDYMFASKGLGEMFILTVFIHGTLELAGVILAAAAGVIMGKSFLFPGTISRIESLKIGVRDGLKIIVGIIPVMMVAAFFEGFVTRHYKMHISISLTILALSFFFLVWYFIIYPVKVQKRASRANQ
jgi:uncharacterized membrane protein SpoIIM required for sporulation